MYALIVSDAADDDMSTLMFLSEDRGSNLVFSSSSEHEVIVNADANAIAKNSTFFIIGFLLIRERIG